MPYKNSIDRVHSIRLSVCLSVCIVTPHASSEALRVYLLPPWGGYRIGFFVSHLEKLVHLLAGHFNSWEADEVSGGGPLLGARGAGLIYPDWVT